MTSESDTAVPRTWSATLSNAGYRELFLRRDGDGVVGALWSENGLAGFTAVIADPAVDAHTRFLAAEVVYRMHDGLPEAVPMQLVAAAYAAALAQDFIGMANPWGLPETLGEVSLHVVELGQAATPYFLPLLDDTTPIHYAGSEAATVANRYQYRVKDIAAFLLSRIEMVSYGVVVEIDERDRRIDALRAQLNAR